MIKHLAKALGDGTETSELKVTRAILLALNARSFSYARLPVFH